MENIRIFWVEISNNRGILFTTNLRSRKTLGRIIFSKRQIFLEKAASMREVVADGKAKTGTEASADGPY